jgi:quercetin 2,3-dioxygenase
VLLVLSGEPINESAVSSSPFAMNTREDVLQAVADYDADKMGPLQ